MQTPQILQARSLLIMALLCVATATPACAQGKPKRMIPGPSIKELVPESSNSKEDGISQIIFAQLFKQGPTEYTRVGAGELKGTPPLPTGYVLFKDLVYRVKTEAIISGSQITVFGIPSVESETDFGKLSVLHLEDDEMSPEGRSWSEVTVFPGGWDEHFHSVPKARYDALRPDFKSRRIAAITDQFGLFAVALSPESESESNQSFPQIEVVPSSSPDPVRVGDEVTHTILVKNKGSVAAAEVNVKESLNGDFDYVSVNSDQGFCKPRASTRVVCHLGALPAGATATMTVVARVNTNVMLVKDEKEVGNIIEVVFKERPTDFVESRGQIHMQFNTTILKKR